MVLILCPPSLTPCYSEEDMHLSFVSPMPKEEIVLFVSGGGSSFGVRSVLNGTVEIGLVSRHLKEKE